MKMQRQEIPNGMLLWKRFQEMDEGKKAQLRRYAKQPEDLRDLPAFYALFPGQKTTKQHQRLAFFLTTCIHKSDAEKIGIQLARAKVSELRLFQMVRSDSPQDLVYLRRLCQQIEAQVNWNEWGKILWHWGEETKRRFVEDYFIALYGKANKSETKREEE